MIDINQMSLDGLPAAETDEIEYKSSLIDAQSLKREIQNAASAFWNSGGGIFLAGVNNNGVVDGGIPRQNGRQPLEDWLTQVISAVNPPGDHTFRIFEPPTHAKIEPGKCVLSVRFAPSSAIPHQSTDGRYYIRVGAHTVPAPHFIVESLYAKRHFRVPRLVYLARLNAYTLASSFLHVEIIAATEGVALDVRVDFNPRPGFAGIPLPIDVPIVDREHPFGFRFEVPSHPTFVSKLIVTYRDFAGSSYRYDPEIDVSKVVGEWHRDPGELGNITQALRELKRCMESVGRGGLA